MLRSPACIGLREAVDLVLQHCHLLNQLLLLPRPLMLLKLQRLQLLL
jgi:hypothetical protein